MSCEKFVRYGADRSARCPRPAKWKVTGHAGSVMKYCGIHAREWRKAHPERVTALQVSERTDHG